MKKTTYLIVTFGFPGSGKTHISERLAAEIGAVHLNSDRMRFELSGKPRDDHEENKIVFRAMDYFTSVLLQRGISVIYDANVTRFIYRKRLMEIAKKCKAKYLLLNIEVPVNLALQRLSTRHSKAKGIKTQYYRPAPPEVLHIIKSENEPPKNTEPHIDIDGREPWKRTVNKIIEVLK
jgi:predicted kinase